MNTCISSEGLRPIQVRLARACSGDIPPLTHFDEGVFTSGLFNNRLQPAGDGVVNPSISALGADQRGNIAHHDQ
jgi:hypothetical protein